MHRAPLEAVSRHCSCWKWENHFAVGREMQYPTKRSGFYMIVHHEIHCNDLRPKCWGYFYCMHLFQLYCEDQLKWYKWEVFFLHQDATIEGWKGANLKEFAPNTSKFSRFSRDFWIFVVWTTYLKWPSSSGWVGELTQKSKSSIQMGELFHSLPRLFLPRKLTYHLKIDSWKLEDYCTFNLKWSLFKEQVNFEGCKS